MNTSNWKFDGNEDVLDSREIVERYNELAELETRTDGELAEMLALEELRKQGETCADWDYGETLIHESHFTDYAEELITECYPEIAKALDSSSWPMTCLKMDWDMAARDLKTDYTPVEFNGSTYWIRS